MTIRVKLIIWFFLAALLPAGIITMFAAGEAGRRFSVRVVEELEQAARRGEDQLLQVKKEIEETLRHALDSGKFNNFAAKYQSDSRAVPDAYFAEGFNTELSLDFDFFIVLNREGIVITSLEWPIFAGKEDLDWGELQKAADGQFLVGKVTIDQEEKLALRSVIQLGDLKVIGGREIDGDILKKFRTSARSMVFLHNKIQNSVLAERDGLESMALDLERALEKGGLSGGEILLERGSFLVEAVPLSNEKIKAGEIVFLYPKDELDEEISSLWMTFFVAASVGIVLALILGVMISKGVAKPLREMIYGFDLVSLGDFSVRLKSGRKDELGEINYAFNGMVEDLENLNKQLLRSERVAAWQEIARKIAHEIKNPLSPIQISIETLRKVHQRQHPDFEEIFMESTITILEEVEKIRRIVQEFSDFARMPEPAFQETDLHEVIDKALRLYKPQMSGVELETDIEENLPLINADPEQLHRLLINIIANSLDALDGKGKLSLAVHTLVFKTKKRRSSAKRGLIKLIIADDGPGMDEAELARVFTPYFTTKTKGTGLGLVIVQKIIEQHKGRLNFNSLPGKGTRVEVVLPFNQAGQA